MTDRLRAALTWCIWFALGLLLAQSPVAVYAQGNAANWVIDLTEAGSVGDDGPFFRSASVELAPDGSFRVGITPGRAPAELGGNWQGDGAVQTSADSWAIPIALSGGAHNLLVVELYDLNAYAAPSARILACNGTLFDRSCDTSIPMVAASWTAPAVAPPIDASSPEGGGSNTYETPPQTGGEGGGCETYCLNGVSVNSPFCDCAPDDGAVFMPPDQETLDVFELFGAALAAALGIGGLTLMVRRLRRPKPAARPGGIRVGHQVRTPPPDAPSPQERILTDVTGKQFRYERDAQGRWVNPETGGVLNEAQWQEYNRHVVANREFVEQERERQSRRQGTVDRRYDEMVAKQEQVAADLRAVQQMQKNLLFNPDRSGLWRGRGEPGDMYTRLEQLRAQLEQGEPVNRQQFNSIRRLYSDHVHGKVLAPEEMPSAAQLTRETLNDTLDNTLREVVAQQTSDGSFSWKGMALRLVLNTATAGNVEMVLTPLESTYTMRDYVARGGNSAWEAFALTAKDVVIGEIFSVAGEVGAKKLAQLGEQIPLLNRPLWNNFDEAAEAAGKGTVKPPQNYRIAPDVDVNPHLAGMPEANVRRAKQIADQYNVQLMVRPTNADARVLLERGVAVPKPELIKNKTINTLDTFLGAAADDVGKVGHFHPTLPPRSAVPPELYEKVKDRWVQRWKEFRNQRQYVDKLVQEGKLAQRNGVLHEVLPDGKIGKPFTGDHDLFEILDAYGRPCPEPLKSHVLKELKKPPFSAQHGPHMDWNYDYKSHTPGAGGAESPWDIAHNIDQKIRGSHAPNGSEPLIQFAPGTRRPIQAAHYVGG